MRIPDSDAPLHRWLATLDAGDLRRLLAEATIRVEGMADWLQTQLVAASDDPADLLALVNGTLTPTHRFYDYWQANRYATDGYDTVQLLAERSEKGSAALVPVIERALTLTTRAILKSDDSSGAQGELVRTLLDAHARAVRTAQPPLTQTEQTKLVKWIVKYRYEGTQDFFDPDIVAYAPGLSTKSLASYRSAIAGVDLGEYGRYPLTRLAVLDRDADAIVAAHGGEPHNAMLALLVVDDLEEAGLHADAVTYARKGLAMDQRGWDDTLVTFLVDDALASGADEQAVTLRREWMHRFPSSTSFARLRQTADQVGVWQHERVEAEALLAEREPTGFAAYLLENGRGDEAWDFAVAHIDLPDHGSTWLRLCTERAKTRPADTLPVYSAIVDDTLVVTDKRNYRAATKVLTAMRQAADAAGPGPRAEYDVFLAGVVDRNRRRPTCIDAFARAGLIATH